MTRDEAIAAVDAAIMLLNDEEPDEPVVKLLDESDEDEPNEVTEALTGLGRLKRHIEKRLTFGGATVKREGDWLVNRYAEYGMDTSMY